MSDKLTVEEAIEIIKVQCLDGVACACYANALKTIKSISVPDCEQCSEQHLTRTAIVIGAALQTGIEIGEKQGKRELAERLNELLEQVMSEQACDSACDESDCPNYANCYLMEMRKIIAPYLSNDQPEVVIPLDKIKVKLPWKKEGEQE